MCDEPVSAVTIQVAKQVNRSPADSSSYEGILANVPEVDQAFPSISADYKMPDKVTVFIYRFPYGYSEHPSCVDWLINTQCMLSQHPRVSAVGTWAIVDTPTDMVRNRAIKHALDNGVDFAVFVDSDMFPDYEQSLKERNPSAKTFLPDALDFALKQRDPVFVGAPYCSAPPDEMVLITKWTDHQTEDSDGTLSLVKYSRSETIGRYGFERVATIATGLAIYDMRAFRAVPGPWFYYAWEDKEHTRKSGTEDVVMSRDFSIGGIRQFVYWSAWAGHYKEKLVKRPEGIPFDVVPQRMARAVRDFDQSRKEVHVNRNTH